jgi:hypothetical protein
MTHLLTADERQLPDTECSSVGVGKDNALYLQFVGTQFESQPEHRAEMLRFLCFSSIQPGKFQSGQQGYGKNFNLQT